MKSAISIGSFAGLPPAESAFSASSSTSALLSAEKATIASVCAVGSASSFGVKSLKRFFTSSITYAWSLTTMDVPLSSVKRGSNVKPSCVKKLTLRPRSSTARLTKMRRLIPFSFPSVSLVSPWPARELIARVEHMCRNIRVLHNFEPAATPDEIQAAALQYVRKISGTTKPSRANEAAFALAVDEVAAASHKLLASLVTAAPPRDREVEAAKAKARA